MLRDIYPDTQIELPEKAELVGIKVEVSEESCTSKASFLDLDEIPVYDPNK